MHEKKIKSLNELGLTGDDGLFRLCEQDRFLSGDYSRVLDGKCARIWGKTFQTEGIVNAKVPVETQVWHDKKVWSSTVKGERMRWGQVSGQGQALYRPADKRKGFGYYLRGDCDTFPFQGPFSYYYHFLGVPPFFLIPFLDIVSLYQVLLEGKWGHADQQMVNRSDMCHFYVKAFFLSVKEV